MLFVTLVIKLCIGIKEGMHLPYKAHLVLILSGLIVYSVCIDSSCSCDPVVHCAFSGSSEACCSVPEERLAKRAYRCRHFWVTVH